jgi:MOSC domain-containing protein YiiM
MSGRIVQVSVSCGGVPKTAVPSAEVTHAGDRLVLEITRYTSPCLNIRPAFSHGDYSRVSEKRHPGWSRVYARVVVPGRIMAGDPVELLSPAAERSR